MCQKLKCVEHPLPAALEAAHRDMFVHVPARDDAQFGLHTGCILQENCQRHIQNNEVCTQIMVLAMCIRSCEISNELVFCQWYQRGPYLTP